MRIGVSRASRPRLHTRRPYSRSLLELATSFLFFRRLVSPHPQLTTSTANLPRRHPPHRLQPPRRRLPPNRPHALLHRQRRPPPDRPPALLHPQGRPPPDRPPALFHPLPPACPLHRPRRRQALGRARWPRPTYCQYPHRDSLHCRPLPRHPHHLRPLHRLRRPPWCHHHQPRLRVWVRAHHRRSRRCQRPPSPTLEPRLTSSSIEILSLAVVCAGSNQHGTRLAQSPMPVKHKRHFSRIENAAPTPQFPALLDAGLVKRVLGRPRVVEVAMGTRMAGGQSIAAANCGRQRGCAIDRQHEFALLRDRRPPCLIPPWPRAKPRRIAKRLRR